MFFRFRVALLTLAVATCSLSDRAALAHHESSTARLDAGSGLFSSSAELSAPSQLPVYRTGAVYETHYFSRTKSGSERYTARPLGRVYSQLIASQLSVLLPSRTFIGLTLPAGLLVLNRPDSDAVVRVGLGDVALSAAQDLLSFWDNAPLSVRLLASLSAPTGYYEPQTTLSVSQIENGTDGSFQFVTYNAQASLGAGAWTSMAALQVQIPLGNVASLVSLFKYALPLSRTEDDILWGADFESRLAAQLTLVDERLDLLLGGDYRRHSRDNLPPLDEDAHLERVAAGPRDELALDAALVLRSNDLHFCEFGARIPVWQRVSGVQLVETIAGYLQCSWGVSLARR